MNIQDSACQIKLWSTVSNEFSWLRIWRRNERWTFHNSQASTCWPTRNCVIRTRNLYCWLWIALRNKTHSFLFFPFKSQTQSTFMYQHFIIEEQFENGDKTSVQSLVSASVGYTRWIFFLEQAGTSRLFTITASLLPTFNANRRHDFMWKGRVRKCYATMELLKFTFKL